MKKFEDLLTMNLQFFGEGEGGEGANVTESAEQSEGEVAETETEGATEEAAEPQTQSPETNAAFADMRRRMEAAEKRAADLDAMYARQFGGYNNPETGQPIRSARDYAEALAAQERMQARQKLQENNIDPSLIDNMIANSPAVRRAEEATAELNTIKAQQQVDRDIEEVIKLDPSLSSKEELLQDPLLPQMLERVRSGMSFVDAYKIVNFERLSEAKTAAAKQSVVNQVKGQSHLTNGKGVNVKETGEDIPASMVETFKEQFPGKTMAELKALYNKAIASRR